MKDLLMDTEYRSSLSHQVIGKCPTVSIDKTDGCQVYLSKDSLHCVIVSAKSSEMNILIPEKNGEYVSTCHVHMHDLYMYVLCTCRYKYSWHSSI